MKLFEELVVWGRTDDNLLVKYRCFRDLSKNLFSVQSADFFKNATDSKRILDSEAQSIELFLEESPETRCTWHRSLLEAIKSHTDEFDAD